MNRLLTDDKQLTSAVARAPPTTVELIILVDVKQL